MSGVNPVAAGGFSAAAHHYQRSRPTYARAAVGLLKDALPPGPVLDLAAGTGILTGQLIRSGREVVAAEPLGEMIDQLRLALPGVSAVRTTAEALAFRDGAFAGVAVAQAFHWFEGPAALSEIARVLRRGGVLAMVWNLRDESVDWVRRLTDLIHDRTGGRPYDDHREYPWEEVAVGSGHFDHVGTHRFVNPVPSSPELIAERTRSTSFVALMTPQDRERLLAKVAELISGSEELAGRDRFDFPHNTVVHLFAKR